MGLLAIGTLAFLYTFSIKAQINGNLSNDSILRFDFEGMHIGTAVNEEGPTGTTVFYFPRGVMGAADIRGGATGTLNAHVVNRGYESKMIDAVVFSGGSWYGLSAATGVANGIKDMNSREGNVNQIAGVLGGIIYDVGGRRYSRATPDDQLGREALLSAKPNSFPLGAHGAGRFAMQGSYYFANVKDREKQFASWPHSGQGAAFAQIGETKIAVFTVVNALGAIVDRNGQLVRCYRNSDDADCISISKLISDTELIKDLRNDTNDGPTNNTTLTLVVTNKQMPYWALQRLAVQVHTSMGRAIQPFSTQHDGDVLYAVTTAEVDDPGTDPMSLTMAASELAWDAVLNSVPKVPELPRPLKTLPSPKALEPFVGTYEFYGGARLNIFLDSNQLKAQCNKNGGIYFNKDKVYNLLPASDDLFILETPAKDVIKFNSTSAGTISGLTLNPGPWHLEAGKN